MVLVAHLTVKFFGTSVEWTNARKKKKTKKESISLGNGTCRDTKERETEEEPLV